MTAGTGGTGAQNTGGTGTQNTGGTTNPGGAGTNGTGATGGFGNTSSQTGLTPCGNFPDQQAKFCQAGQYCADMTFSECVNGCLNNANCASDQTCIKAAGENAGTCQNNPGNTSCEDVCDRVLACDPSTPRQFCAEQCVGFNEECKTCLVDVNCIEADTCWDACGIF